MTDIDPRWGERTARQQIERALRRKGARAAANVAAGALAASPAGAVVGAALAGKEAFDNGYELGTFIDKATGERISTGLADAAEAVVPMKDKSQTPDAYSSRDAYFKDNYNTHLDPEQEGAFLQWAVKNNRLNDLNDYDMRGAWLAGAKQGGNGHFTDKFKKPNHPTFSDQSIYHGVESPWGWPFEGGRWSGDDKTGYRFIPSERMFVKTHDREALKRYFAERERGVTLVLPE